MSGKCCEDWLASFACVDVRLKNVSVIERQVSQLWTYIDFPAPTTGSCRSA